jgi:hypothetical protein
MLKNKRITSVLSLVLITALMSVGCSNQYISVYDYDKDSLNIVSIDNTFKYGEEDDIYDDYSIQFEKSSNKELVKKYHKLNVESYEFISYDSESDTSLFEVTFKNNSEEDIKNIEYSLSLDYIGSSSTGNISIDNIKAGEMVTSQFEINVTELFTDVYESDNSIPEISMSSGVLEVVDEDNNDIPSIIITDEGLAIDESEQDYVIELKEMLENNNFQGTVIYSYDSELSSKCKEWVVQIVKEKYKDETVYICQSTKNSADEKYNDIFNPKFIEGEYYYEIDNSKSKLGIFNDLINIDYVSVDLKDDMDMIITTKLTNTSDKDIYNVKLSTDMASDSTYAALNDAKFLIEEIDVIKAGETIDMVIELSTGDISLPMYFYENMQEMKTEYKKNGWDYNKSIIINMIELRAFGLVYDIEFETSEDSYESKIIFNAKGDIFYSTSEINAK